MVTYNLNDIQSGCLLSHTIIFGRKNFKDQLHTYVSTYVDMCLLLVDFNLPLFLWEWVLVGLLLNPVVCTPINKLLHADLIKYVAEIKQL